MIKYMFELLKLAIYISINLTILMLTVLNLCKYIPQFVMLNWKIPISY